MKLLLSCFLLITVLFAHAQEEVISPLMTNPNLKKKPAQNRIGNSIDSTFVYVIDTLDVPVWDDFSVNKFEQYNADFGDGNVTSQYYYHLMNATNTVPQNPTLIFCDSTHAHFDTVRIVAGFPTTEVNYFTPNPVWVNDLSSYPVQGQSRTLFQECYVLIDSIIDLVLDPDQDTIFYTSAPDFVQDSANVFSVTINDPNRIWVDNFAYHNYTYAVNPWSLGVATFDGVGADGWPYDWGNTGAHEKADVLTSKPINLAGTTSVYLTFIYQAEGNGDAPEANDSLILEWWLPDSSQWYLSQWYKVGGITNDIWDTAHVAVPPAALDNGFRFRFRNWANTSGNLDHWHIDYVNLKANDIITMPVTFNDVAISQPINSLLIDYTAVPWDHYKNAIPGDKMLDTARIKVYNSHSTETNFADGQLEVRYGGILQGGSPFNIGNLANSNDWNGNWELGMNTFRVPIVSFYEYDPLVTTAPQAKFDVKINIDADVSGGSNLYEVNDTTYYVQKFDNYYAYDDGSAEAAYGITGSHGLLAYKFTAYEEDTLTGILMHFVPSVDDVSGSVFLLTVWDDNAGSPGTIIYQDDYFNTSSPEYEGSLNGFRYYTFQDGISVKVSTVFYVGWEQIDSESLNIGLDRNINNGSNIFRNVTGTWVSSSQTASLMMRPVFSTGLNYTLSDDELIVESTTPDISIYPNPAHEFFTITGLVSTNYLVTVFDMSGRSVHQSQNQNNIDISLLNSGLYIVDIRDENGVSLYSGKLIKE